MLSRRPGLNQRSAVLPAACTALVTLSDSLGTISHGGNVHCMRSTFTGSDRVVTRQGILGCGAHTDWGVLTLLIMDSPGLQIRRDGAWQVRSVMF